MKKDLIFFGEQGLTSTSANFIANQAKEYYMQKEAALRNVKFYSTSVCLIGCKESTIIETGITNEELAKIPSMIDDIALAKSLIAWLREAIKARQNLIKEVQDTNLAKWCENNGIKMPEAPICGDALTEDEYYGSLGIKERNAYYALETKCATIGQFIHPTGSYAEARSIMTNLSSTPHKIVGTGRDATIYNYSITVDPAVVENQFFDLQFLHREAQAKLNSIKFECQKAIEESKAKVSAEYKDAYANYSAELGKISAQWKEWQIAEIQKISAMKITLPDHLKGIYDKINSLG